MSGADPIERAREIIGPSSDDDYIIEPTRDAERYKGDAPGLASLLQAESVKRTAQQYEQRDTKAVELQNTFKQIARRANLAVLLTACMGAGVLLVSALLPENPEWLKKGLLVVVGIAGAVCGGLGKMWLSHIEGGKLLEKWMMSRADAETYRLEYFKAVTDTPQSVPDSDPPSLLLQLEYFRRYQLDVQIAYYRIAAARHQKAAHKTLVLGTRTVLLAAIATGLSGVLCAIDPAWAAIAVLGVVAAALTSYSSMTEAIQQDRRNAERYPRTHTALMELGKELDRVRRAAAGNQREAVEKFVAAVHEQLSLEHRQWLQANKGASEAFKTLAQALDKLDQQRAGHA